MTALEEARAQQEKLSARLREYQAQAREETDLKRKAELKSKIMAHRTVIRDVMLQIEQLDPQKKIKSRKAQCKRLDIGAMPFDFFERNNLVWSDLEGHSWQQVEAGDTVELGINKEQLCAWIAEASQQLSDRQRIYLDAYYNDGLSLMAIAQKFGVHKSTVSRGIRRGLARMKVWIDSKKLIVSCADEKGVVDLERYILQVPLLSERQRQLMLLAFFSQEKSYDEIAKNLGVDKSTVSKTLSTARKKFQRLKVPLSDKLGDRLNRKRHVGLRRDMICHDDT